jgi:hypothetical protein
MAIAQCQLNIEKPDELTVGQSFLLHCDSSVSTLQNPELRLDPADNFKLRILKGNPSTGDFIVTSLSAGQHQIKAAQLVDASQSVVLSDLQFTVKSVLDPKEPKKEPFGPMGPLVIKISPLIWALLAALILSVAFALFWGFYRSFQKRKLLRLYEIQWGPTEPMAQLSLEVRRLKKKMETASNWVDHCSDLRMLLCIFVARFCRLSLFDAKSLIAKMPALKSDYVKTIEAELKSEARLVLQVLSEIERLQKDTLDPQTAHWKDAEQLISMTLKACDSLSFAQRKKR